MSKTGYPNVVVVGRTNVGKSTLFNRLSSHVKSIVFDLHGVTRDLIKDLVEWQGKSFTLVDTGGMSFSHTQDFLVAETRSRAVGALEGDVAAVLFVCDGSIGLLPEDRDIARMLHKKELPVILVVNKSDTAIFGEHQHEFERLGFKHIVQISALHSKGIVDILEGIVGLLPANTPEIKDSDVCRIVILGKPNVGKSSLMNSLLGEERAIVSEIPGTTREPIEESMRFYQQDIILTDTAGVRKKRAVDDPLELLMAKSTLHAVKYADIVLLMVDASSGQLADQEVKLAFYAFEKEQKALIIIFNKKDLLEIDSYAQERLASDVDEYEFLMKRVEKISISCKTGYHVGNILPLVQKVKDKLVQQFSIQELTLLFKEALEKTPLYKSGHRLILYRAQQIKSSPHIIALYVNNPLYYGKSQRVFFENVMRKKYLLTGVPIIFVIRKRE
jgi:GTPase